MSADYYLFDFYRSGKTSIKNVVFHKMEPSDTLFLDPTTKTNLEDISCCSFITFQVYDCSGQIDLFSDPTCDSTALLKGCGSLIFVIDAQVIHISKSWDSYKNYLYLEFLF